MSHTSEEKTAELRAAAADCKSVTELAARCGVGWHTARRFFVPSKPSEPEAPKPERSEEESDDGNKRTVVLATGEFIKTEADAVRYAEVDTRIWRVKKWGCGAWQVGMKLKTWKEAPSGATRLIQEKPHTTNLWRVWIELERLAPKSLQEATEALIGQMERYSPRYPKLPKPKKLADPHLWEIDLFDVHIGKLAWRAETGQDYDLRIAEGVFRNALHDLIARATGFPAERILIPVGNDFFQVDNLQSATTKGTRVDSDGRYAKIIELGTASLIRGIEALVPIAPVDVLWVPGNHDRLASYHLCRELRAWFRHTGRVNVDVGANPRKYYEYGDNLIGFTHGDREKERSLPAIMLSEAADLLHKGQCREWHLGHQHRTKAWETTSVNEEDGVTVRRLASLSATDAWHHESGYVGNRRAAEVFIWGKTPGLSGHFYVDARESPAKKRGA